jgi:tetratricopeptide (TPR) repeat protein
LLQAIQRNDLVWFDNYESVLTPQDATDPTQAEAIQRLAAKLIDKQAHLLLTSRAKPAGLRGEQVFPSNAEMAGLESEAAVKLFLQHSRRSDNKPPEQHRHVAQTLAKETHGHPLAIILLAGAYDARDTSSEQFLADWGASLARATKLGLDPHHITIDVAIERSLQALEPPKRARLIELSHYDVPFFTEAAALLWGLPYDENGQPTKEALAEARIDLALFHRRSLLQVHSTLEGSDQPATYQFQPVLRQALHLRLDSKANKPAGYYIYGAWLAKYAYGEIMRSGSLAQLVNQCMPLLEATINELQGEQRLWHIRRVAWLYQQYGELQKARSLLEQALEQTDDGSAVRSAFQYQLAQIHLRQGQYERAMSLFQQSLDIQQQLQDLHGKAASLHAMAQIHRMQGQYERAMSLFQQSLDIQQQLQDLHGKAASLHAMAQIHRMQGQYERAMSLFQQSLDIQQQLQDLQGVTASLSAIADLHMGTQHWMEARKLLQEALAICQQLSDRAGIAFNQVKLGQICLAQADYPAAQAHFQNGLAIFEELGMPREIRQVQQLIEQLTTMQTQQQTIERSIDAWITSGSEPQQRIEQLMALLDSCAQMAVHVIHSKAPGAAQHLADAIIPLRVALKGWPPAAELPPFNTFLGCLQALLRQQPAQLERLRAKLDAGLAQALQRIEQNISNTTPESQIEQLRAYLAQTMPQALRDSDQERKEQYTRQLEQLAAQAIEGEAWQHLVALLRACVALLRGQAYDEQSLQAEDLVLLQQWQQLAHAQVPATVITAWEAKDQAALQQALAELPEIEQQASLVWLQQQQQAALEAMDPAEREEAIAHMQRQQIEQQADAAEQATQAALQSNDEAAKAELAGRLVEAAEYFAEGEEAGSPYAELALFLQALAAHLRNEALPIVPPPYAERITRLVTAPTSLE